MHLVLRLFELSVIVCSLILIAQIIRFRSKSAIVVAILALFSVTTGEIVNGYVTGVTSYHQGYLLWLPPDKMIPVYIIMGGILFSTFLFLTSQIVVQKLNRTDLLSRLLITMILTVIFPLVEMVGMKLELWYWNRPSALSLFWFIGVWIFYFLFVGIPPVIGQVFDWWMEKRKLLTINNP